MANYQTGKKMYTTLSDSIRNSIRSNDVNVFKNGAKETFETGYGAKTKDTEYLDAFLSPYTSPMEQALKVFDKDAINGLQELTKAAQKALPLVGSYLQSVPTGRVSEDNQKQLNVQINIEKIVKELTKDLKPTQE